jgi:Rrf2 family protein
MIINRTIGHALVAVGFIATNSEDGPVLAILISKEYDIAVEFLHKILQDLVRAGVLRSKRGPRGGFSLARPIEEITMLQIIEAVDGLLVNHLNIAEHAGNTPFSLKMEAICQKATKAVREIYGNATLDKVLS